MPAPPLSGAEQRMQSRLLRVNTSWAFIGNIGYSAGLWGLTILIAKLAGTEALGRYALATAITAPIVLVSRLHLRGVQATDLAEEFRFGHYVALRIAASLAALGVIALAPVAAGMRGELVLVVWAVGLFKLGEGGSDVLYGYLQRHERLDLITHSLLFHTVGLLASSAFVLWWSGDLALTIGAMLVVRLLVFAAVDTRLVRSVVPAPRSAGAERLVSTGDLRPVWDRSTLVRLAVTAAPLGLAMFLVTVKEMMPRYVLASAWGEAEVGIYVALVYFVSLGGLGVSAVGQAVQPRLAAYAADAEWPRFWRLLGLLLALAGVLSILSVAGALVFGRWLLDLVYTPEIAEHHVAFAWVLGAGTLSYGSALLGFALTATRQFQVQVPAYGIGLLVTGATALFWIPSHDVIGASWAVGVGTLVQAAALGAALLAPPERRRMQRA